ncbi:acyl carrier protein [Streptomyces sp. AC555_RSS877]|uniref:acyl carrier protein n=1 Tax=Streptomyces sp. AC555_RSS877 TaxID=2823688 RepID=UPI001C25C4BE|nr:acyl carrier protein [Streptomyces sp. AC555_RSS877]
MTSHSDTREALSRLWLNALDSSAEEQVADYERFFQCGGNSIAAIKLYMETEEQLAVTIDSAEFLGTLAEGDFGDLARLTEAAADATASA